jgi:uncharacterized membrane protein YfcA
MVEGTALAILFFAYFVRGISGFGSGLIAVPLLALSHPLTLVVPFILLTDLTASVILGRVARRAVRWDEILPILPGAVVGVVLGVTLLISLDRQKLLLGLGLIVLFFALRNLLGWAGSRPVSRAWALPASLVGGTVSALFGTGGPPYVIYLSHRLHDKSAIRATFSALFMLEGGLRVLVFAATGLLREPRLFVAYALALPVMAAGLWAGSRVHVGLSNQGMMRLIGLLLLASGTSLLWKAWQSPS